MKVAWLEGGHMKMWTWPWVIYQNQVKIMFF